MKVNSEEIMSEAENLELETEFEVDPNPTLDLINALQRGDFNAADQLFKDTLGSRVQDTLDAEKMAIAGQVFNGEEPYADIEDEDNLEDLDIDSELEEIEDVNFDEIDEFIEEE